MGADAIRENKHTANLAASILVASLSALSVLLVFVLAAPRFSGLQDLKIAPEAVRVLPHEGEGPFRRKRVNETEYDLKTAHKIPIKTRRQYTYNFDLGDIPATPGEVFVPVIGGRADVYLNGVRIGGDQEMETYIPGFARRFIRASIPLRTYQMGINRLTLVMRPDTSFAGLPALYVGKAGDFSQAADTQIQRTERFQIFVFISGLILLFIASLGLFLRRGTRTYAPLFVIGLAAALLTFLSNTVNFAGLSVQIGWALGLYIITGISLLILGLKAVLKSSPVLMGLWTAAMIATTTALLSLLPLSWPLFAPSLAYLAAGAAMPFALAAGLTSLSKDRQIAKISEAALQEKIARQDAVIAAQEKAIEDGLKAKGRLEERQRLTRDIHDGIGGHLLSLLVRVRDGDMSQTEIESDLQYGLNDLRLIVDSMDHSEGSLDSAFVTFRARAKAQLNAAGIALIWQQSEPFVPTYFGPAAILNIYRLMQEAVTNTIRHAKCDTLIVNISRHTQEEKLVISLTDNGVGFDPDKPFKAGQGVKNMRYRAKTLGADLAIAPAPNGGMETTLSLEPETSNKAST